MRTSNETLPELRQQIQAALVQLNQLLPRQGPLPLFTHQNPLHGYQDLPFEQAILAAQAQDGALGYYSETHFRDCYAQGRISDANLFAVLHEDKTLQAEEVILNSQPLITKGSVYRIAMLFDIEAVLPSQLAWQIEELNTLEKFQPDVSGAVRQQFLATPEGQGVEKEFIAQLWQQLLNKLGLQESYLHPENMLDLSLDQAEALLARQKKSQKKVSLKKATMHERMQEAVIQTFAKELSGLGKGNTLRNVMMDLCGVDILDNVRPQIIRICSSALDEGVSAWQLPERSKSGMYAAWKTVAGQDINPFLQELPDWHAIISELPDTPEDAIIVQLSHLGIPEAHWAGYLRCLALEIPGWSGMVNWRERHADYIPAMDTHPALADYLAIRLTLDRLWLNQICRDTWQIEATVSNLKAYFRKNTSEYMVRRHLFRGNLPEYLIQQAEAMTVNVGTEHYNRGDWQTLADIIWTWQGSSMINSRPIHSVYDSAWPLFRLCQHLGLNGTQINAITQHELEALLSQLRAFTPSRRRQLWHKAYEYHYRDDLLQHIQTNHNWGRWINRETRPGAQVIFSLDNRVENIRRYLEDCDADIETFGALDFSTALNVSTEASGTQVNMTSADLIATPYGSQEAQSASVEQKTFGIKLKQVLSRFWFHSLRGNVILSPLLMLLAAPLIFIALVIKGFLPKWQPDVFKQVESFLDTRQSKAPVEPLTFLAEKSTLSTKAHAAHLARFFKTMGINQGFSAVIVLLGQRSSNQVNNALTPFNIGMSPLQHDGHSAQKLAALANDGQIRAQMADFGVIVSDDSRFIAAELDLSTKCLVWYGLESLPDAVLQIVTALTDDLQRACRLAVDSRRDVNASQQPIQPDKRGALPFLKYFAISKRAAAAIGYCNAAAAVIGKRSVTQGLSLNQRVFLASYDQRLDTMGENLETLLLSLIPVLTEINLAYFFAGVNSAHFGSGNSLLHNSIGLIGVMEGSSSDLRPGLPKQLTEHHEAMRLHLVIETEQSVMEVLFARQPSLNMLMRNGWVLMYLKEPETGCLKVLDREQGFIIWRGDNAVSNEKTSELTVAHG